MKIVSTTYYQPKMNLLKDYRLSSDLIMNIKFPKKEASVREPNATELHDIMTPESNSFWESITFNYNYDAFPGSAIPKTQYSLSNGLTYSF